MAKSIWTCSLLATTLCSVDRVLCHCGFNLSGPTSLLVTAWFPNFLCVWQIVELSRCFLNTTRWIILKSFVIFPLWNKAIHDSTCVCYSCWNLFFPCFESWFQRLVVFLGWQFELQVMYAAIIKEFHTNDYGVAWLGAIFQLCKGIFTIPGGFALHRFGCRTCFRAGAVLILCLGLLFWKKRVDGSHFRKIRKWSHPEINIAICWWNFAWLCLLL